MTRVPRAIAALAVCALITCWSASVGGGSAAQASDPFTSVNAALAQPTSSGDPDLTDFSLTISPTRLVVGADDTSETQEISVFNGGATPMAVTVDKRNFTGLPDGSLSFDESAPYSASEWVTVHPASFEIAPGATQIVTADIEVPASPEPGDHQVALVFLVPAGHSGANVRINRGVATPVYITVAGPIDDTVSIRDLDADGFAMGGPITISATVYDTGTVHRDFRDGDPLTVEVAGSAEDFPDFTVMRDSVRDVSTTWDPPLMCICHPTVAVTNADGTVSSASVRVVVFPLYLAGLVLAGILLMLAAAWMVRRRYRNSVALAAARLSRPVGDAH